MSESLLAFKETILRIGKVLDIITDVFGFMGFGTFLLLLVTMVLLWFLNLISPLDKKINFFLGVGTGLGFAWMVNMSYETIGKYLLIVLAPLVLSYSLHFLWLGIKWLFSKKKERWSKQITDGIS